MVARPRKTDRDRRSDVLAWLWGMEGRAHDAAFAEIQRLAALEPRAPSKILSARITSQATDLRLLTLEKNRDVDPEQLRDLITAQRLDLGLLACFRVPVSLFPPLDPPR